MYPSNSIFSMKFKRHLCLYKTNKNNMMMVNEEYAKISPTSYIKCLGHSGKKKLIDNDTSYCEVLGKKNSL